MGRQNSDRGIVSILEHIPDCRAEWFHGRRTILVDFTYQGLDHLTDVHEYIAQHEPCTVIMGMDMGTWVSHFVGAYVGGKYCTSGIATYVAELMISSLRSEPHPDVSHKFVTRLVPAYHQE